MRIDQDLYHLIANAEPYDAVEDNIDAEPLNYQKKKRQELEDERFDSDTKDRRWLAEWSATVVSIWLFLVLIILFKNRDCIHLSDSVINVLLGTTTLNVLGLTFIVLKGHFNSGK